MKNLLILVFSLFLCTQADAQVWREKAQEVRDYLNETGHLDKATDALDGWCSRAGEKVLVALEELVDCFASGRDLTFCEAIREKGLSCSRSLIEVVQDCIPPESEEIPELAVKSVISGFDFICKQNGSNIIELSNKCLYDSGKHSKDVMECMQNPRRLAAQFERGRPGRNEICDYARMVRACVAIQTNRECRSWAAKRTIHGLYDAFLAPCNQKVQF